MSLKTYISNDLDKLVFQMIENIGYTNYDIFQTDILMVQTEGLSRWISVKASQQQGIFSNFKYISPNNLINDIFRLASMRLPEIYNTNNLKWLIFNIINENEFKEQFPDISKYYIGDSIKQLQLATKLSDLFDQYTFFRPDYIQNWNNEIDNEINIKYQYHEKWQKWIWQRLKTILQNEGPDKVQMFASLLSGIQNDETLRDKIKEKYPHISVFGFSTISQFHINILLEISQSITDVDFYLFSPSPEEYWLHDIPQKTKLKIERYFKNKPQGLNLDTGNRMLMDLGKTARYFYLMIFNNEEFLNTLDNETLTSVPSKNTLLNWIQNDIYNNTQDNYRKSIPKDVIFDHSIQISSHFTLSREVEALHNYLLKLFDSTNISPKEVIIQTPNIDKYVPYIISVFENSKNKIPYTIADRSYHGFDNFIGILDKILTLREDEFTSEQIFQLLHFKPISDKFEIEDLQTIRIIIEKANIRFGISGNTTDDSYLVSWNTGIEKIILGFAMYSEDLYYLSNKNYYSLPLEFIENDFATEGLKLINFVKQLIVINESRKTSRSLNQWKEFIQSMIESIFLLDDSDIELLHYIYDKLSFPGIIEKLSGDNISYDIFINSFIDSIYQNTRSGNFLTGNVTFCSMTPMRSIPFKVVGILGLDFGSFPRKNSEVPFDLMNAEHRPGDRNNRESDKYLFLEALLSAKEKLYLSYIGQNSKSNSEIPPSPVIDKLLDYIFFFEENHNLKYNFITKHPLHSFNSIYSDEKHPEFYTYSDINSQIKKENYLLDEEQEKNDVKDEIYIDEIFNFYKNSIEYYFKNSLNIYYRDNKILLPETEVFDIDNLQKYLLSNNLLEFSDESKIDLFIEKEKIKGNLPLKSSAYVVVDEIMESIKSFREEIKKLTGECEKSQIDFNISLDDKTTIICNINDIFDDKLILVSMSKNIAKNLLKLQIYRIALSISNKNINHFYLLNHNDKKTEKIYLPAIDSKLSNNNMQLLLKIFEDYQNSLFIFTSEAAHEMHNALNNDRIKKSPEEKFIESLEIKSKYNEYLSKFLSMHNHESLTSELQSKTEIYHLLANIFFKIN
ncbi:MAG: exodeoxyribonuclease V subunit gamma [Saprospiraceae bacterium]